MTIYIHPYNLKSGSAVNFKAAGIPLIGGRTGLYRQYYDDRSPKKLIANWGMSDTDRELPFTQDDTLLNPPAKVALWSDKGAVCQWLENTPTARQYFVEHTQDIDIARSWLDGGCSVVCRTLTRASNGRGITLVDPTEGRSSQELITTHIEGQRVQLWTKYQKKLKEYRVHVGYNYNSGESEIITSQRKGKRRDAEYADTRIRNAHDTGAGSWVFLQDDNLPQAVLDCVINFWNDYCTLDFGGVDVIWNRHHDRAWIVEINTAPGVGEQDVQRYIQYFQRNMT